MQFGIADLSVVPVRAEAADKSEMVTQLLFGETFEVLSEDRSWRRIRIFHDGYEGWIDYKQFLPIDSSTYQEINTQPKAYTLEFVQSATSKDRHIPLSIGSNLPAFDGLNFRLGKEKFVYNGQTIDPLNKTLDEDQLQKVTNKFLGAPYLWGGRSPFGIDCSGLVQVIYKLAGIAMPRDAYQQAAEGKTLDFIHETRVGDLAFFDNEEGHIIHVGIVLAEQKILHASGKVRVDNLDHYGIFNIAEQRYSHKLRILKRVLN